MIEKVSKSHPDKVADRIAGALVDLAYEKQKDPKIAVEVLIGHGKCHIIAETSVHITDEEVASIVHRIAGDGITIDYSEVPQDKHLADNQSHGIRCGDNGIFKGVPLTKEQKTLSRIAREIYKSYPTDGKYILDGDKLIICQSNAKTEELRKRYPNAIINPLGDWTGGTDVDSGATNRKLGSDMADSVTGGGLCVSSDTEYIGEDLLWHRIDEFKGGKVGQWNNGVLEFVTPISYIHNDADSLIYIHNETKLSMCLTPYHQMLIKTSKGNFIKREAGQIADKLSRGKVNSGFIPHSFTYPQSKEATTRYNSENELRLQVAFCADGTIINEKRWTGRIRVKKQQKKERLRMLLADIEHKETIDGKYSIFWLKPPYLCKSLHDCFRGEDLSIVYDELYRWDGDVDRKLFRTTHKEDADFAQFVIASQGKVASITVQDRVNEIKNGYTVKSVVYTVHEMKSTYTALRTHNNGKGHVSVVYLDKPLPSYCFTVPSHNLVLRHDGRIFITGNCGKDLSKADVSVNIYAFLKAQKTHKTVRLSCAIGDDTIDGRPYAEIVEIARQFIKEIGGFEKFAEWGLY